MKKPLIDLSTRATTKYLQKKAYLNRFTKLWGTTTKGGVEVYNYQQFTYPASRRNTELIEFLQMTDSVNSQNYDGVDAVWLYINSGKITEDMLTAELIASMLEGADGVSGYITVDSPVCPFEQGDGKPETLTANLKAEYGNIFATKTIGVNATPNGNAHRLLLLYGMYGSRATVTSVERRTRTKTVVQEWGPDTVEIITSWAINITVTDGLYDADSDIVEKIYADISNGEYKSSNPNVRSAYVYTSKVHRMPPDEPEYSYNDSDSYSWDFTPPEPENPDLWVLADNRYYLKRSAITEKGLTLDQKVALLTDTLDMDYQEEKKEWWETLAIIILVIIVVYVACTATGPAGCTTAAQWGSAMLYAGLAVTALQVAAAEWGDYSLSDSAAGFNKSTAPIMKIAALVAMQDWTTIAKAIATREAIKYAVAQGWISPTVGDILEAVVAIYFIKTGASNSEGIKANMRIGQIVTDTYYKNRMRTQQEELAHKLSVIEDQESQMVEQAQQTDFAKDFIKMYRNMLTNDWSRYDNIYERPYNGAQRLGTQYSLGNICTTSVKALNLADQRDKLKLE